jgi:hypothetical protein
MTEAAENLDNDAIWNFARGIQIPDQAAKAPLVELMGSSDNVDKLIQGCIGEAMFICVRADPFHDA